MSNRGTFEQLSSFFSLASLSGKTNLTNPICLPLRYRLETVWRWAQERILSNPASLVKLRCACFYFRFQCCVPASPYPTVSTNSSQSFAHYHVGFSRLWRWAQARILPEPSTLVKSACAYFHYRSQLGVTALSVTFVSNHTNACPLANSTCINLGARHRRGFYQSHPHLSNPFVLIFTIVPNSALPLGQSPLGQPAHTGLSPTPCSLY